MPEVLFIGVDSAVFLRKTLTTAVEKVYKANIICITATNSNELPFIVIALHSKQITIIE